MGDKSGARDTLVKQLVREEGREKEFAGETKSASVEMAGLRRVTEADRTGDVRSLERALTRTLYLLVKRKRAEGKEGAFWSFPNGTLEPKEGLKEVSPPPPSPPLPI
jgi:large subunit ribosomal protein L46